MERQNPLPLRALNHISRVCRDVKHSSEWYSRVLGFVEVKRPSSFDFEGAWLFNYGIGLHLIRGEPVQRPSTIIPKSDHLSFSTESLVDVEGRLSDLGIDFVKQTIDEGGVRVTQLFLHDPDNNMIEICNCDLLPVIPLVSDALMCPSCVMPPPAATSHSSHSSHSSMSIGYPSPPVPASPVAGAAAAAVAAAVAVGAAQVSTPRMRRACSSSALTPGQAAPPIKLM